MNDERARALEARASDAQRENRESGGRPGQRLAVRLSELHDLGTGRLDAAKVAEYPTIPLKQLSEALGGDSPTVHRTPYAVGLQEPLCAIKRSVVILVDALRDRTS